MQLSVNGIDSFVATGGREFDPSLPTIALLHGAPAGAMALELNSGEAYLLRDRLTRDGGRVTVLTDVTDERRLEARDRDGAALAPVGRVFGRGVFGDDVEEPHPQPRVRQVRRDGRPHHPGPQHRHFRDCWHYRRCRRGRITCHRHTITENTIFRPPS